MALPEWLESGAAIAGIVSGVIAVLGLAGLYFAAHPHIEKRLAHNAEYRARRAKQLREVSYFGLYRRNLERALAWLQEVMGPPWSPRAFGVCLTLALGYAWLFLLGSWLFAGGAIRLGGDTFLAEAPIEKRGGTVVGMILFSMAVFCWRRWAECRPNSLIPAFGGAVAGIAAAGAAVVVNVAGVGLVIAVVGLAGAGAVAGAIPVPVTGALAGAVGVTGWLFGAFDLNDPDDAALLLFLVALPAANSLWDWASWWISRWLGADLATQIRSGSRSVGRKVWTGLWHSGLDLGAALVLLAALAWTLPNVIEWFLPVFADEVQWCAMAQEPFGEGLWVTSMLLSTLVPTALHLAAVVASPAAALALRLREATDVAEVLEQASDIEDEGAYRAYVESRSFRQAADSAAFYFALVRPLIWTLAAVFVCLGLWGLIHVIWLGLDGLLVFLPRIDTLPEFVLGVAYDLDFTKAAACFASQR